MEATTLSEASVYVGTYGKYNNGSLFGAWLDLSDYADKEEFYEACRELHKWKSHSTLTLLATQDLPTFLYYMIDPLKSWCWGAILFYPFKNSRFS